MYVSQFTFDFPPEEFETIIRLAEPMVEELRKTSGCRQVIVLRTGATQLSSLVTYETRVHAEAATSVIAPFFARLAPHLETLPRRQVHPALIYRQF